jgi:hypothetical protein
MQPVFSRKYIISALCFLCFFSAMAQSWEFVKETNGIKLFLRDEKNTGFKAFHGETVFKGDFAKACSLVGDPAHLDWWGDDIRNIKVLAYEKGKHIRYYFVYDTPWPYSDRDLVAEVQITTDTLTGAKIIASKQLSGVVPLKPGLVRVNNFWQKWTIKPAGKGMIAITLEGFIDPSGNIPAWLYNMVITDIPLRLISTIKTKSAL